MAQVPKFFIRFLAQKLTIPTIEQTTLFVPTRLTLYMAYGDVMVGLEQIFESGLPLATSILALIPFVILLLTYKRTRSSRILFATLAFATFVAKGIILSLGLIFWIINLELLELAEFGTDFLIVLLFTASFLLGFREKRE